ncbi:phosphotransferase [Actinotalea sp.]|uniref:phosphotransferase n=1 Tax=Actinotalea sp. TaxID=1872145 RepID=UPI003564F8FA
MPRSPLVLAALATVAIPDLDAVDVRRSSHTAPGIDAAVVIDAEGTRWVVQAPQDAAAGATLEAEVALLGALASHAEAGELPFAVPVPEGSVALPEGGRAIVHRRLAGRPLDLAELGPGPGLAAALGAALAALHELPTSLVEDTGLPVYRAEEYRERRLSELDEAAGTGRVPTLLLRRWERALEDVALWRFQPTVVHGDLSVEHVLCAGGRPVSLLGWSEAKVADPADDLAWLLVAAPQEAVDPILEAYHLHRTEMRDPHLADRALLAGELAVARWLLHGVHVKDEAIVDDAQQMLEELAAQIAENDAEAALIAEAEREAAEQAERDAADLALADELAEAEWEANQRAAEAEALAAEAAEADTAAEAESAAMADAVAASPTDGRQQADEEPEPAESPEATPTTTSADTASESAEQPDEPNAPRRD